MKPFRGATRHLAAIESLSRGYISQAACRSYSSGPASYDWLRRATNAHLKMADQTDYNKWTKTGLIQKLRQLETELKRRPAPEPEPVVENGPQEPTPGTTKPKEKRKMDPSKYSTRYIALKLAYLGKNYGGFEFQAHGNEPTIEEELWNALTKACLIFPEDEKIVDWECCEYSKCGRTDRGVSAFGQVIGIRVRSNRPLPKTRVKLDENGAETLAAGEQMDIEAAEEGEQEQEEVTNEKPFDDVKDEIPYPRLLNRLLPADIRVLAWCPNPPPEFSARFSCRERQYRYFFTQPAFSPDPSSAAAPVGSVKPGWLDIEAMRDAAKRFEGEQDFRNVCKIDPAKLITNWSRTIFESDIVEVKDANSALAYLKNAGFSPADLKDGGEGYPKVYYFHIRGSAFLWHQIRHMVALLFLVGQGLESPSLIRDLLDVTKSPRRPNYVMADEVPLVLWDCIFPDLNNGNEPPSDGKFKDTLQWVHAGAEGASQGKTGQFGQWGVMDGMWQVWREKKVDELLANQLLQHMATQIVPETKPESAQSQGKQKGNVSVRLFEGGNTGRQAGKYVPVLKKDKLESADELNDKYAKRKGYADAADMRAQKSSRMNKVEGEDG